MKKIFITDYINSPDIEKKFLSDHAEIICLNEKNEKKFPDKICDADGILGWHTKLSEITSKYKELNNKLFAIKKKHEREKIQKDIEQEICIILMFLGIYLMLSKMLSLISKSYLFKVDFLENMLLSEMLQDSKLIQEFPNPHLPIQNYFC